MDKFTPTPIVNAAFLEINEAIKCESEDWDYVVPLCVASTLERELSAALARVAELEGALRGFEDMDTVDQGTSYANSMRDKFIKACPEYVGFCELARAALSPKTEGK